MKFIPYPLIFLTFALSSYQAEAQSWNWTWTRKVSIAGLNDPFCANPLNNDIVYSSPGNNIIVISRNRGKSWSNHAQVPGGNQIKSIKVSVRDTSVILVAQEGQTVDRIMKSTNNGMTWNQTLAGNFYYFGHPLAYEPLLDDETVYTMASNVIYRSTNFGSTWDSISSAAAFGSTNAGWEDAVIRPDSSNILFVADNATGIWKSTNHGSTWRRVHITQGEIPALALNKQNPAIMYATRWAGSGGFVKSTDYGETWNFITQFNGLLTWGVDVSTEHPDYVAFGTWGPSFGTTGGVYISRDAGATWERTFQGFTQLNNHAVFILDTSTVLSLWGNGIWKLLFPGIIAGTVFNDENQNGIRDSGEVALSGWKVKLAGTRVDSTTTDVNGGYRFSVLPAGAYTVSVTLQQGWGVVAPVSGSHDSLTVTDGETHTGMGFAVSAPFTVSHTVSEGWNLLSLPVSVDDPRKTVVFPGASSPAYTFSQTGYTVEDSLNYGRGYWVKFPFPQLLTLGGLERELDTVEVFAGWNLIASLSRSVNVDSIVQDPPGIIVSDIIGYTDGLYASANILEPMRGYWVKSSQPGMLILRPESALFQRPARIPRRSRN